MIDNLKFTYLLANVVICRHGIILDLILSQIYIHNYILARHSHFEKALRVEQPGNFQQNRP